LVYFLQEKEKETKIKGEKENQKNKKLKVEEILDVSNSNIKDLENSIL
jgi:ribosome-associated protein YbcJ (S4-like RNA binding protein)